ncbi:MAG: transcription-repair coupling factor, partial [Bdellovibrionales bacterium]|nr:transcription-repair coupling factor [Bdellovibrionales bacterium]
KYVATEGKKPIIDKLSSNKWQTKKRKVKEAIVALAGDLIKLYAIRNNSSGFQFTDFNLDDEDFADSFAYSETEDQLTAIKEVLEDMSSQKPMDRLVCGDVGFGKTEVAMRAAFKAVQDGKQVAILSPTTILAEQHRISFEKRFLGFPVNIAAVSRFYKTEANKSAIDKLSKGDVDIIIGTHKLLQKDIHFKDLGLLVIDEEHRFGVKQKEKLKQVKKDIDVLSLTATPIPRTLHMSLLNVRDVSLINTPPQDRRSVRTYVAIKEDGLIRDAILREIQRGGQCFFLHNRVQSIELVTAGLSELVPEAKFAFGHGQMKESELEKIMKKFLEGEIDVLVSTTIIESGIDIPNANTLIVDKAHTFGLAQLYQIRGRVGRSSKQAYAYLLIPPSKKLGKDAEERLKALQALDDLGQGFNLAMRDLEIRGAGNLLGKEQSGNVLSIGFEMYTKILKEAAANLKGEDLSAEDIIDPEVKLGIDAFIPDSYIPDVPERLVLYQRLASLRSNEETDLLIEEIIDRFGPMSKETINLVEVMRIRALLRKYGISKIEHTKGKLRIEFSSNKKIDSEKAIQHALNFPDNYKLGKNNSFTVLKIPEKNLDPFEVYKHLEDLLDSLST